LNFTPTFLDSAILSDNNDTVENQKIYSSNNTFELCGHHQRIILPMIVVFTVENFINKFSITNTSSLPIKIRKLQQNMNYNLYFL
jgi:hypothetical protein